MSGAANQAKTKWNAEHYMQVKVSVEPSVAAAFKAACQNNGRSMASAISDFMALYASDTTKKNTAASDTVSTRGKRRRLVCILSRQLEQVRGAEEDYLSNIPENLQGGIRAEAEEHSIAVLDEVIELLGDIY